MALFPNIRALSSKVDSEIKSAFTELQNWISRVRKEGGFVTRQDMVDTGLFDAALKPHVNRQLEIDATLPMPTGIIITEEIYATNVESVIKSAAWVEWNAMGPRVLSYEYNLYSVAGDVLTLIYQGTTINTESRFRDLGPGTYLLRLRSNTVFGIPSIWNSETFVLMGKDAAPNPPAAVLAEIEGSLIRITLVHPLDVDIASYSVREGETWGSGTEIRTLSYPNNAFLWSPTHVGDLKFWAMSKDTSGIWSTGVAESDPITVHAPSWQHLSSELQRITPELIDNVATLRWPEAAGSYAVDVYEIKKGLDYATAEIVGVVRGTFAQVIEMKADTYKYWVTPIDVAKIRGDVPLSIYCTLTAPPDFVLRSQQYLNWGDGTRNNCVIDGSNGHLVGPVDHDESFAEHFIREGTEENPTWDGPSDQVAAGYELFVAPGTVSGTYVQTIDCLEIYGGSKVTLDVTREVVSGDVTITPKIEVSTDNSSWTVFDGVYQAFSSGFRYMRITLTLGSTDGGVMDISQAIVRVDVKYKTYSIAVNVPTTPSEGVQVDFEDYGFTFIDAPHVFPSAPFLNGASDPISVRAGAVTKDHCHVVAYDRDGSRFALSGANVATLLIRGV